MSSSQEYKKRVLLRLAKAIGHSNHVFKMIDSDVDRIDTLNQLKAVQKALDQVAEMLLMDHLDSCFAKSSSARADDKRVLEELWNLIRRSAEYGERN
jgi:DNA-binding FrmR family transcriptional regulator